MKTKRLLTCDNSIEAHLIQSKLDSEGIESFLTNENFASLMPMFNNMMGSGIQVMVDEVNYDRAFEIVKDKISPDNVRLVCPNCGSTDVRLGFGKNKILKIFNIFISLLAAIPMGNLKPKYYCKRCNTEIK